MLKNYLKVALRHVRRHKGYAALNIVGLAIGMAACLTILRYVQDEQSYDRYHEHAGRIYRVALDGALGTQVFNSATTSAPMAATLQDELPEVERATRIWPTGRVLLSHGDRRFYEDGFLWADAAVFDVFTFPLVEGDPATALAQPNTIVLTRAMADKYFPGRAALGQTLRYDNRVDYTVTGVLADVPPNSHFQFDFLASLITTERSQSPIWISNSFYTYLLVAEGHTGADVEARFPALIRKYVAPQIEQAIGQTYDAVIASGARYNFYLQPLTDIYLHSKAENDFAVTSDVRYVYILTVVALFILLIACINFVNLSTARSAGRAREVGLRKVLGSARPALVRQFLGESMLLAALAMGLAVGLMALLLPLFNNLTGKALSFNVFTNPALLLVLVGMTLGAGLLAGLYPALVLSAFRPAAALKGQTAYGPGARRLRSTLVVAQFTISIALLISTGVVSNQLRYMQDKNLGFTQEQVVVLPIETEPARAGYPAFRETLLQHPNVVSVGAADAIPGRVGNDTVFRPEGAPNETLYNLSIVAADVHFIEALEIRLAAGRGFSQDFPADATGAFVINAAAAREMGFTPEAAVGKRLAQVAGRDDNTDDVRTIVGVVEDFHIESLQRAIRPLAFFIDAASYNRIAVRIRPEGVQQTMAFLEAQWQAFEPAHPYRHVFLDADFGRLYAREQQLGQVFGYFTLLALLIAGLGLFGLASFVTTQRTKEIGVRKVMGASVPQIVVLLSRDFTLLVGLAFMLAAPVAYLAMSRWLQGFAYQTSISPWTFALAGGAALLIAWLTVGYQTLRAALADPVEALRYE